MDRTRENLTRVEDILSELTERVEPLKQQSEVAREYLALRDELKILDLNVFLMRTERYETRIRELKEYGLARRLPGECAFEVRVKHKIRTVYGPRCLAQHGWRIGQYRY